MIVGVGLVIKKVTQLRLRIHFKSIYRDCENLNYNFSNSKDCRKSFEIDAYP